MPSSQKQQQSLLLNWCMKVYKGHEYMSLRSAVQANKAMRSVAIE